MTDNPPIRTYVNKKKKIALHVKLKRYYLKLLTLETMNLLGITKNGMTRDKNGEKIPYLEIIEVVLVHCNVVNNDY